MQPRKGPFGLAEYTWLAALALVAGLVAWGLLSRWTVAIVPGLTYALASSAAYLVYRRFRQEAQAAQAGLLGPERAGQPVAVPVTAMAQTVAFRVVAARGACLQGRRLGDLVTVDPQGTVVPHLCPYGEATLRLATRETEGTDVKEWCCPIYDHLLVFRREPQAA